MLSLDPDLGLEVPEPQNERVQHQLDQANHTLGLHLKHEQDIEAIHRNDIEELQTLRDQGVDRRGARGLLERHRGLLTGQVLDQEGSRTALEASRGLQEVRNRAHQRDHALRTPGL